MHRIEIMKGNKEYSFDIERYKLIIGKNDFAKHEIFYILRNHFSKTTFSEFATEYNQRRKVMFDGNNMDVKRWKFIEINPYFDVESDFKLGTKSLMNKYLSSFSIDFEQNETFRTASLLLNSLNDDFFKNATSIDLGDKEVHFQLGEIARPIIFKEAVPCILSSNSECNTADLDYEEIILLQLNLLIQIAEKNKDTSFLSYCFIPYFTPKIKAKIISAKSENLFILISTNTLFETEIRNISILATKYIDFANSEMIIDRIMDMPFHIEKEELIEKSKNILFNNSRDVANCLYIELFS